VSETPLAGAAASGKEEDTAMHTALNRRRFLTALSLGGAVGLVLARNSLAAEPPPETTTVRLPRWIDYGYCWTASYIAGDLLRAEGLTDVRYVQADTSVDNAQWLAHGDIDFDLNYPPMHIASIDAGVPIKVLTGVHSGCLELIAKDSIRSVPDLRGSRVGVDGFNTSRHTWLTLMAAYVGLDPVKDIRWVLNENPVELFIDGKIDALLGEPPYPQQLRARKIGHTIVSNAVDRPWSQYFCCMAVGRCDHAVETLSGIPYDKWRDYDAEDSIRFYALRMHEAGFIKSSRQKIIAEGTDWHFLDELKRELKA
jgi:NitT/TauT family transport system substrate-binding protein